MIAVHNIKTEMLRLAVNVNIIVAILKDCPHSQQSGRTTNRQCHLVMGLVILATGSRIVLT